MSNSESDDGGDETFVDSGFDDESVEKGVNESYEVPNRSTPSPSDFDEDSENPPQEEETPEETPDSPSESHESDTTVTRRPPNTTSIDWAKLMTNESLAEHALVVSESVEQDAFDVAPPSSRPLASAGGTPPNSEGVNFRLTPTAQDNEEHLRRLASDTFEEDIGKAYVRDAIVRIAARHPDEVMGLLAAYGFDQPFE